MLLVMLTKSNRKKGQFLDHLLMYNSIFATFWVDTVFGDQLLWVQPKDWWILKNNASCNRWGLENAD